MSSHENSPEDVLDADDEREDEVEEREEISEEMKELLVNTVIETTVKTVFAIKELEAAGEDTIEMIEAFHATCKKSSVNLLAVVMLCMAEELLEAGIYTVIDNGSEPAEETS